MRFQFGSLSLTKRCGTQDAAATAADAEIARLRDKNADLVLQLEAAQVCVAESGAFG